jgi:large subunit ribosomal protein L10
MSKQATKIRGRGRKTDAVTSLNDKLSKTKAVFFTDYRGLTHQQLEALRKSLKKVQAEYLVAKNTLIKIALKNWNAEALTSLEKHLNNPTATLFTFGDEIAAIKELAKFIKNMQLPKIKAGYFAGSVATESDFTRLATLPEKPVLLATLCMRMMSPLYGLQYALSYNLRQLATVLSNVKDKKGSN